MEHQQSKDVCAHVGCSCTRREDSKYCSPYCEDAGDTLELACNCGHPGCGVEGSFVRDEENIDTAELVEQKA